MSVAWRRSVVVGYAVIFGALGTFSVWAGVSRLDGAVIAAGVVTAESSRKTIQHLEGGIVREILVRDGDQVRAGQLLVRLDPTRIETQGDMIGNQLVILLAQEARLLAEFDGREQLVFPEAVTARRDDAAVATVIADQRRTFESRRGALLRETAIAQALVEQARKESEQIAVDVATATATLKQVDSELASLRPLFQRSLVPMTRMAPLERERLRLAGIIEGAGVQTAKLRERVDEMMLRKQQVAQTYRDEASQGLLDVRRQLIEVRQQGLLVADSQRRTDIRSPIDGTVQQLRVFTVGGVVRPGESILDIAPLNDALVIRAKISPADADRVSPGMGAEIKFPSFSYWGSDVIRGTIQSLSRDRIVDAPARDIYVAGEVVVDRATVPRDILTRLTAGMPADVVLPTGERTVAEYLLRPLAERWQSSMRER